MHQRLVVRVLRMVCWLRVLQTFWSSPSFLITFKRLIFHTVWLSLRRFSFPISDNSPYIFQIIFSFSKLPVHVASDIEIRLKRVEFWIFLVPCRPLSTFSAFLTDYLKLMRSAFRTFKHIIGLKSARRISISSSLLICEVSSKIFLTSYTYAETLNFWNDVRNVCLDVLSLCWGINSYLNICYKACQFTGKISDCIRT